MPQPLFMEVTESESRRPRIIGLAHIRSITVDANSQVCISMTGDEEVLTVELWDQIRTALGIIQRFAP